MFGIHVPSCAVVSMVFLSKITNHRTLFSLRFPIHLFYPGCPVIKPWDVLRTTTLIISNHSCTIPQNVLISGDQYMYFKTSDQFIIGSISNDNDGNNENIAKIVNLCPFKFYCVCQDQLNLSNVGDFSWS